VGDLRIPATAALLEGWTGPVVLGTFPTAVDDGCVSTPDWGWQPVAGYLDRLSLDLARDEVADHVARRLAERVGLVNPCDGHGFTWHFNHLTHKWCLGTWSSNFQAWFMASGLRGSSQLRPDVVWYPVPALAALDPSDDARLPGGARRVDRLALRACWLEASRE
jgi:hypothetical protein